MAPDMVYLGDVPYGFEKNVYNAVVGRNSLEMSIRSSGR